MLTGVEAMIFDFDGTLAVLNIDFPLMRERTAGIAAKYGLREDRIKSRYALEMVQEAERLLGDRGDGVAGAFFIEASAAIEEIELSAAVQGSLLPGVVPMLAELKEKGYSVGIVSRNCDKAIKTVFPDVELHCGAFLPRDRVEKVKPDPEHLNRAICLLGVESSKTAYVGDHLMDVKAGKQAGVQATVGVLTGRTKETDFKEAGADLVIESAAHIARHLLPLRSSKLAGAPPGQIRPSTVDAI